MKYQNDNQRKDVNIETNSCNHNEETTKRLKRRAGNFRDSCEWPNFFLVKGEMAFLFLENRDFIRSREP